MMDRNSTWCDCFIEELPPEANVITLGILAALSYCLIDGPLAFYVSCGFIVPALVCVCVTETWSKRPQWVSIYTRWSFFSPLCEMWVLYSGICPNLFIVAAVVSIKNTLLRETIDWSLMILHYLHSTAFDLSHLHLQSINFYIWLKHTSSNIYPISVWVFFGSLKECEDFKVNLEFTQYSWHRTSWLCYWTTPNRRLHLFDVLLIK